MEAVGAPITERSNELSANIDLCSPEGIVRILRSIDAQIFSGWSLGELSFQRLLGSQTVDRCVQIACHAAAVLADQDESSAVVLSGCGTSGRLAFITARRFNQLSRTIGQEESYRYICAGGDRALLKSQEAPEDDPAVGVRLLRQVAEGKKRVLFVGITCGLSAPFVAGQLDYCLSHLNTFTPVLIGFNPVAMARKRPIDGWDKTFHDVVIQMSDIASTSDEAFILNPVVGPEAITGSTRMKSGSATKILLDTIFLLAHQLALCVQESVKTSAPSVCLTGDAAASINRRTEVFDILSGYQVAVTSAYFHTESIADVVALAGNSLRCGRHVFYIATSRFALFALLDASECPPTYGADYDDVRAFVDGGYACLGNVEGDLTSFVDVSLAGFTSRFLPNLQKEDLVLFIMEAESRDLDVLKDVSAAVRKTAACTACLQISVSDGSSSAEVSCPFPVDKCVSVEIPVSQSPHLLLKPSVVQSRVIQSAFFDGMREIICKCILNAVSTGAFVMCGKVMSNAMIDLQVSNSKLFHRSISIIQRFTDCSEKDAHSVLLRSIHETDNLQQISDLTMPQHITTATGKKKVVPRAILMERHGLPVKEAAATLRQEPTVRKALLTCFGEEELNHG